MPGTLVGVCILLRQGEAYPFFPIRPNLSLNGRITMWYVVQTTTGKEQELVDVIRKLLPGKLYKDCFFIKREFLKRLGGQWLEVTETLFPAYVFLEMDTPEAVFYHLKALPEFTRLLGDNQGQYIPLEPEEVRFLKQLCGPGDGQRGRGHLVKSTLVSLDESGTVQKLDGPLQNFENHIVKLNLRKRYAIVELTIRGQRETAKLGIRLEKDEPQKGEDTP